MPTEAEIKELIDRTNALEKAFVRMEPVPQMLEQIRQELKEVLDKQNERAERRDDRVNIIAETLKDYDRAGKTCRESTEKRLDEVEAALVKGNDRFESLDKKVRDNQSDVEKNFIRKVDPTKQAGKAAIWVGLIAGLVTIVGVVIGAVYTISDSQTKAAEQSQKNFERIIIAVQGQQTNVGSYQMRVRP